MEKLDQLKTFDDACKVLGLDPTKAIPDLSSFQSRDQISITAYSKLVIIARAANQIANDGKEWIPDWDNGRYKYWPYFYSGSSGFRFRGCVSWYSASNVGSRLCFISREVAEYVGETFVDVYKDFMVI